MTREEEENCGNKISLTMKRIEADRERVERLQIKIKTGNKDVLN